MTSDHFAIRVVVVTVAIATLLGTAAIAYLSFTATAVPDQLDRLVTLLAAALIAFLSKTSSGPQEVTNLPGDVLDVDPTTDPKKAR